MKLDKCFLLCYTDLESDGMRHYRCAWFGSEPELYKFAEQKEGRRTFEIDFAIEISNYRLIIA